MSDVVSALKSSLGERVRTDAATLEAHRHDSWVLSTLLDLEGRGYPSPQAVVVAQSTEDVSQTLRICREAGTPVIPFGGGSGVCGQIQTETDSVVLSTRGLDGLVELDDNNLLATFKAGTMGDLAEAQVQANGLTIGHWPQSIALSTVGGWVATRAAGQYSSGYGNIEDILFGLEVVLPDGSVLRTHATPRAAAGPDLRHLFMGAEGTLGVITEVTFSLRALPETVQGQCLHFPTFAAGLETIREFIRRGWRPPVVRLYDAPESYRHFSAHVSEGRNALVLVHEGPAALVDVQLAAIKEIAGQSGGEEASSAVVDHWLESRNRVPTFKELLSKGLVVDTIEVACKWDQVQSLYDEVVTSLNKVPDLRIASAHSSHSYRSGTNLYFTFVAKPKDSKDMADTYRECWRRTMEATIRVGGGIAHHHGIGRIRRDFLAQELGEAGLDTLRKIKSVLDPDGLLNPGALLPEK